MAEKKKPLDLVRRGSYGSDLLGNTLLIGLRALDPLLQRHLLLHSPLPKLASKLGLPASPRPPVSGGPVSSVTGLTPYQTVIWAMSVGSAAKHIFWKLSTAREAVYPGAAVAISVFNTVFNSLNTLLYLASAENPTFFPPWSVYVGTALYVSGLLSETVSEVQRHYFKSDPKNQGKIYTGGLFSIARHVSYTGYSMWRAGYALAAGGPLWGVAIGGWFLWDFGARAVPVLDEYMTKKYGEQWVQVKREVPYALIPGIW
ncbi:uncharacterized protein Z520_04768 [Fonsecaea multimorphosa CBS 102226]|uniref:Steroid 5-alpha reductase C-terminal domain-containing protein n=1 Tax=Fonsecaea multimorphosa CBS 102226 TaxID=1442371 RepID=A0A0D2K057_9EURO|nr:uncharacterized protein Z520_04768 [Fonsecaea multimorphosa CBS 102226]KIX99192.1 hypothetical protein Z520_04768 [Fonsecaea multimorphosa CBS 102226]OAL25889.1 hypothetical protein AYO22_04516 [Fonsecaea multimorphosa]